MPLSHDRAGSRRPTNRDLTQLLPHLHRERGSPRRRPVARASCIAPGCCANKHKEKVSEAPPVHVPDRRPGIRQEQRAPAAGLNRSQMRGLPVVVVGGCYELCLDTWITANGRCLKGIASAGSTVGIGHLWGRPDRRLPRVDPSLETARVRVVLVCSQQLRLLTRPSGRARSKSALRTYREVPRRRSQVLVPRCQRKQPTAPVP